MPRHGYRQRRARNSWDYSRSIGRERALQHIEDARRLSAELGGSDEDVKQYFFSLPPAQLHDILTAYGQKYGEDARAYAVATMAKWRTRKVHMSGTVAERLFNLLPPRMPLAAKFALTERLWQHVGPSSRKRIRVGLDAGVEAVISAVRSHIEAVVTAYVIPDALEKRFTWISAGDVTVKQQLLNHLLEHEKALVVDAARLQLPVMLDHMRADTRAHTGRLAQILKIGKHEVEILVDRGATAVSLEEMSTFQRPSVSGTDWTWLWWVIGIGVLFFLLAHK